MDIIKALKENEKPFSLMSEEMQAAVLEFKFADLEWYTYGGTSNPHWETPSTGPTGSRITSYRLRPDYEEEPEVVKCEIKADKHGFLYVEMYGDIIYLNDACKYPSFIGFLYEDGSITAMPRIYEAGEAGTQCIFYPVMGEYDVLTPTHVLFRKGK